MKCCRNFGFNVSEEFVNANLQFRLKAQECGDAEPISKKDLPPFYQGYCNDFETSTNFWQLNSEYYETKDSRLRAEMLKTFAQQPASSENWQRTIVTAMALDSIDSKDGYERAGAAKVMGTHGNFSSMVMYSLLNASYDTKALVRREAAAALRLQGNKSFLINSRLIQLLQDEAPLVRGAAALALRDQAVQSHCPDLPWSTGFDFQNFYFADPNTDPRSMLHGIPACIPRKAEDVPNPLDPGDLRVAMPVAVGCPQVPLVSSNLFDRMTDVDDVQALSIMDNVCLLHVPAYEAKVLEFARLALYSAIQIERHPVAKSQMIAALRNVVENDQFGISLLIDGARDSEASVRSAAIYALGRAGQWSSQSNQIIVEALSDENPQVRRVAIGAAAELDMIRHESASEAGMMEFKAGMEFVLEYAGQCDVLNDLALPPDAGPSFGMGFSSVIDLQLDLCRFKENSDYPALLESDPNQGGFVTPGSIIKLTFGGKISETDLRNKISIFGSGSAQPQHLDSINSRFIETERDEFITEVEIRLKNRLRGGISAMIVLDGSLTSQAGVSLENENTPRRIGFHPTNGDVTGELLKLMSSDGDPDVRFAVAGLLLRELKHEEAVFYFLESMLKNGPAKVSVTAQTFFNPRRMAYRFIQQMEIEERERFMAQLVFRWTKDVFAQEKVHPQEAEHQDFLDIPTVLSKYQVLQDFLKRNLIPREILLDILAQMSLQQALFERLAIVQPVADPEPDVTFNYPLYYKMHWGNVRSIWIDILDRLFATDEKGKALDRLYNVVVHPGDGAPDPED